MLSLRPLFLTARTWAYRPRADRLHLRGAVSSFYVSIVAAPARCARHVSRHGLRHRAAGAVPQLELRPLGLWRGDGRGRRDPLSRGALAAKAHAIRHIL